MTQADLIHPSQGSRGALLPAVLLVAALTLGGGGTLFPLQEMAVELLALVCAAAWLLDRSRAGAIAPTAWLLAAVLVSVPLIQLVPLPPSVWHALPGRGLEREALALVGADKRWATISLAPSVTLASLLALLPPLALAAMTSALARRGRIVVLGAFVLVALASLVLGALQISGGAGGPFRFFQPESAFPDGFQVSHNAQADLLLIAIMAVPVLVRYLAVRHRIPETAGYVLGLSGGGMALFTIGLVLTASRAGIAMLPIALATCAWVLRPWLRGVRRVALAAAVLALVGLGALVLLVDNAVIAGVVARFDFDRELRPELWHDSLYAARQLFPFGAGTGNFVPPVLAGERLEVVWERYPNAAHNELLEVAVESGLLGLAMLAAVLVVMVRAAIGALRRHEPGDPGLALFAVASLLVLTLHSMVDYPFRSMAIASLGAVCAGLVMAPRAAPGLAGRSEEDKVQV